VFAAGVWAGAYIKARRLPDRFYDARVPLLPKIGRRSFIIYLLHQPILYGITMLILKFR
jgi:peptidoglycan/LPS O-acetylase OafA/YrhL